MSQIPTGGDVHSNEEILMLNQVKAADHIQLVAFVIMLFGAYNAGFTTPNEPMIISGDTHIAIIPNKNHIPDPTVPHPGPPPSDVS
ncbi:35201_t:CDS:2, partial [Gigaspora margarita]